MLTVVSAAIVDVKRRLMLMAQRSPKTSYPLLWVTPGGKVEGVETHELTLRREIMEELGTNFLAMGALVYLYQLPSTRDPGQRVEVYCYLVVLDASESNPRPLDGTAGVGWFDETMLGMLPMGPADNANRNSLIKVLRDL